MVQVFGHQFGSSSSKYTELEKKDFMKIVDKMSAFQKLKATIGSFHATGTKEALWNKQSGNGPKAIYAKDNEKNYMILLDALLQQEMKCVLAGHYFIGGLYQKAKMGVFSRQNNLSTMSEADYGAAATDKNIDKAAKYLIHTSNSLRGKTDAPNAPITTVGIQQAIANAAMYDVRSEATLRDMHRRVVFQGALRPTRGMDLQAPYPSTGGAAFLLEQTYKFARNLPQPPPKDPAWIDLASFLLGAVIRSHGFTDGNGRIGRAAYAAAIVKGDLPLKPLTADSEKKLHGLDQVH